MHIRPLTRHDIPSVARIAWAAFEHDELYTHMFPHISTFPQDFIRWQVNRLHRRLLDPSSHGYVAVTPDDEAMGFAFFIRVAGEQEQRERAKVPPQCRDSWLNRLEMQLLLLQERYINLFDRSVSRENIAAFLAETSSFCDFYALLAPYWKLGILAIAPAHQRKGAGFALVRQGQSLARQEGMPMVLESSLAGRRLYEKCGFWRVWEQRVCVLDDVSMVWFPDGEGEGGEPPTKIAELRERVREFKRVKGRA